MYAPVSTADLLTTQARQLRLRNNDLQVIEQNVLKARFDSIRHFEDTYSATIKDFDFGPGALVLVRNTRIEHEHSRKSKPRYLGPYAVVRRTEGGSYLLTELDGALAKTPFAAFRLIPYFPRSHISIPVTKLINIPDDELQMMTRDDQVDPEPRDLLGTDGDDDLDDDL